MKTIHREIRKHRIAQFFTGPEFSPKSSNRIIRGLVDRIREHSPQTSTDIRKAGSRIIFAQVSSNDNSITAKITYSPAYAPIDLHMMKDLVPAQIYVEVNYDPDANKAYDLLASRI